MLPSRSCLRPGLRACSPDLSNRHGEPMPLHLNRTIHPDALLIIPAFPMDRQARQHQSGLARGRTCRCPACPYQQGDDRIKATVATAAESSLLICDCGGPSRRLVRNGWSMTFFDVRHAADLHIFTVCPAGCNDRPVRHRAAPVQSETPPINRPDRPKEPEQYPRWCCDRCGAPVDRGTDFGGSRLDQYWVRARCGSLIGSLSADGPCAPGNVEMPCSDCVDSLVGCPIQPPERMVYDRGCHRSVSTEGPA